MTTPVVWMSRASQAPVASTPERVRAEVIVQGPVYGARAVPAGTPVLFGPGHADDAVGVGGVGVVGSCDVPLAMLAEATYDFGFRAITAGRWLSERMTRDHGLVADHFEFGCDLTHYQLDTSPGARDRRRGVAYYCRPSTPRRAHELALVALEVFAEQHPEVPIHLYGEAVSGLGFEVTHHGLLTPQALGELYNTCIAGLALSATNVSLVPHEMLAAGCIPVVNEGEHSRLVLDNDYVEYAPPFGLASALSRLVQASEEERGVRAAAAAASVTTRSWETAGDQVLAAIRSTVAPYAISAR